MNNDTTAILIIAALLAVMGITLRGGEWIRAIRYKWIWKGAKR